MLLIKFDLTQWSVVLQGPSRPSYRSTNGSRPKSLSLSLLPPPEEKYMTVQAYTSQGKDEVSFEKGVTVEVIQKNLEGWWYIR